MITGSERQSSTEGEIISRFVGSNQTVLDLGCSGGDRVTQRLARQGCRIVGVDKSAAGAALAKRYCEAVVVGDLNCSSTFDEIRQVRSVFDRIVCSHILEHLVNPAEVVERLVSMCSPAGGSLVIALPNVAFWRARLSLLRGRWDDRECFVFDPTHLHFFTLPKAVEFLRASGLEVHAVGFPDYRGPTSLNDLARRL